MLHERYRLTKQLAASDFCAAYLAIDKSTDRVVRYIEYHCDQETRAELERALRRRQMLRHPAVDAILDVEFQPGRCIAATEWERDESSTAAATFPMPYPLAVDCACQLAELLREAHRLGIWLELSPDAFFITSVGKVKAELAFWRSAEEAIRLLRRGAAPQAEDVRCLGKALGRLFSGEEFDDPPSMDLQPRFPKIGSESESGRLQELVFSMAYFEAESRPSIVEVARTLRAARQAIHGASDADDVTVAPEGDDHTDVEVVAEATQDDGVSAEIPARLGRFLVQRKLGSGGMGTVYLAVDPVDRRPVAIKTLKLELASKPQSLRRFLKEARMLAEVSNPYVTNLLEVNEDDGVHYIVMEYAAGRPVSDLLKRGCPLDVDFALRIAADVARALAGPHEQGIVHRDVKPGNILILDAGAAVETSRVDAPPVPGALDDTAAVEFESQPRVKLTDFGLARYIEQSESLDVTRAGAIVGTPYYMSPEQCAGRKTIDARSDVYSLGVTMFHMLAGKTPFKADDAVSLAAMHCNEPAPDLRKFNPKVSDAVCHVVEKAIEKSPDERYANVGEMLDDINRALRGEPTVVEMHPLLPGSEDGNTSTFTHEWHLQSSPEQLWPYVSNTDRLNHALGLPAVEYRTSLNERKQVERFGSAKFAGSVVTWREHPFEWIEGRRYGVLREFQNGPFQWFATILQLRPKVGGGTHLTQQFRILPKGLMGRTLAKVTFGARTKRMLDRVYQRIDAMLTGKLGPRTGIDPFVEPVSLPSTTLRKIDMLTERLLENDGLNPIVVRKLCDYLASAPSPEVARIRPLALARALGVDGGEMTDACLHASKEGLLTLMWDILCPLCRAASEMKETLRELRQHGRCDACDLDFDLDFANSVEMIFQTHPNVRSVERKTYCVGGPAHSPHVLAQVRIAPEETVTLELALSEGAYRLRGRQAPYWCDLRVRSGTGQTRWEHVFSPAGAGETPALRPGKQRLELTNSFQTELLMRIERVAMRDDALTAARACSNATFRQFYPDEVLAPGRLVNVSSATFVVTDVPGGTDLYRRLGDAKAFGILHEHFRMLDDIVRSEGGATVKTLSQGILAVFDDAAAAVRAGIEIHRLFTKRVGGEMSLKVAIHSGTAMAATLNDRLDYFGSTVNHALAIVSIAQPGDLALSQSVSDDPAVFEIIDRLGAPRELEDISDSPESDSFTVCHVRLSQ